MVNFLELLMVNNWLQHEDHRFTTLDYLKDSDILKRKVPNFLTWTLTNKFFIFTSPRKGQKPD